MKLLRLSTALALAAAVATPGVALAQAEDHEQHHPGAEAGASAEGAAPTASSTGGAMPSAAAVEDQQATGSAAWQSGASVPGTAGQAMMGEMGQGMMGRGMMDPEMMREMHERMMGPDAVGRMASDNAPVIIVVPVPGGAGMDAGGAMPGGGMMHRGGMPGGGMMAIMGGMQGAAAGPDAMGAGRDLAMGVVTPAKHISAEDVRHFLEHRLEAHGNPRLALGEIAETDEDTITAEIVTVDGSLVETLSVDRHSGEIRLVR